jgi:phosphatidylglycerol:prolipoprotein diacylglycerol transferase
MNFPSWLKPEIIPGLPVRWYGLMYIFAFATAFILYRRQVRERKFPISDDELSSMFTWGILALIAGARIFSTLVYHGDATYWLKPWLIFWPFNERGNFTGLQGMSYHGGAFFCALAIFLYSRKKKFDFRETGDMLAASIPLGYTFGRLGNFINGELYGRATAGPLGIIFPHATVLSTSESWVKEVAEKAGIALTGAYVNLPRHPSQLYEMIFEGLILWAIIWFFRDKKPFKGFLIGLYFAGYGFFRFFIEYFREPDEHIGYPIQLISNNLPTAYYHPPLSFSTGQIFCFFMILFGVIWIIVCSKLPNREVTYIYDGQQEKQVNKQEAASERNRQRKLRKKLR